jgi:hypothetical protein
MIYPYKCRACGVKENRISTVAERNKQYCLCGYKLEQDYSSKTIWVDRTLLEYYDHQLGAYISGTSDRRIAEKKAGVSGCSFKDIMSMKPRKKVIDEKKIRKAVEKAVNDVENGKRADVITE